VRRKTLRYGALPVKVSHRNTAHPRRQGGVVLLVEGHAEHRPPGDAHLLDDLGDQEDDPTDGVVPGHGPAGGEKADLQVGGRDPVEHGGRAAALAVR